MKVSIIIPIYNVEKYLDECLRSVVNQTLTDIEVICINDGSTDNSANIIKKYKEQYQNIIFIDQENKGQGYARNLGISIAKGKYVYFLDSDDYLDTDAMSICYGECEENNLEVLTFDAHMFYEEDYVGTYSDNLVRAEFLDCNIEKGEHLFTKACLNICFRTESWMNFYKKEFLLEYEIKFSEERIYEDIIQVFKSYIYAQRVKYIPKIFLFRRVRNNSAITSDYSKINMQGYYNAGQEVYKLYFKERNSLSEETLSMMKRYISLYFKRSIYVCDLIKQNWNREYLFENISSEIIDVELDMQRYAPQLFYSQWRMKL